MVHCVRYLAFGVLQDKGNILLHEIFKVLKFKTHGGERGQWPSQGGLKEHFLSEQSVFFKGSSHCFLPHCNSLYIQRYWKTNENAGTTRLYFTVENSQWLQYYVVPNSLGVTFFFNSDFYFQCSNPFHSLTP